MRALLRAAAKAALKAAAGILSESAADWLRRRIEK